MSELKLNYKASNIAKAEDKFNRNFFKSLSGLSESPSMSDLMFLFFAGGATEEDFDNAVKEGFDNAMIIITEGLNESGFLGKTIDTTEMKKAMEAQKKKAN